LSVYLDASVLLPTIINEPASSQVDSFLIGTRELLAVSDFASAEVASALSRLVRMHSVSKEDALAMLVDFDTWRAAATSTVEIHASDARMADIYVRRFELKLRAPDALHIAVCRRLDLVLATLDQRLALAADELGVGVAELG
jgi:predicted nucleic acid-binding protein